MAISDKLNYLIETKSKFKDRLNSLGAEIINSTTFRNYMVWVNDFYNKASDKTYIAEPGIVGRTSQSETPTPDLPQTINNLTGDIPYKVSGKNLFDKDNATIIHAYMQGSTGKLIAENNDTTIYIKCEPNTTYTIQKGMQPNSDNNRFRFGTTPTTPTANMIVDSFYYNASVDKNNSTYTYTTPSNANYLCVYCYTRNNDITEEEMLATIQIEKGSTAGTYEPYIEPQTFTIPLGDIELCGMDTYKDKIYSNNGRFYLEKNTDKTVLDGDEIIQLFSVTGANLFRFQDIAISVSNISPKSNYFIGVSNSSSRYDGTVYYNYNAAPNRMVFDILTTKFTTVSEFKSWLLTHNTELQFAIPASSTTEITSSNYPALYAVLKEIQDYLTQYKINKEFLLDYSSPEITY